MTASLDTQIRYAQLLSESSLIPKHLRNNPANVLLFLALADAQQVPPAVAFTGFQVIGDTPTMKPEMMRAQIMRHGHTLKYVEQSTTKCVLYGKRVDSGVEHTVEWTLETAKTAGLDPHKGTWAKYPQAMLSARATAELARAIFADCLNGISYTPEELGAEVDDEGAAVAAHARAMEDQARQYPPTSGKVEKVKASADDEFTAPTVEDAPPPPTENRETDQAWLEDFLSRVERAESKANLRGLHSEAKEQHRTGKLTTADLELVGVSLTTRAEALDRAEAEKAGGWPDVAKIPGADEAVAS